MPATIVNWERDYVDATVSGQTSGQGGHRKRTALRSHRFAKKGVMLRHSNQGKRY
jgi:hypothetical protein